MRRFQSIMMVGALGAAVLMAGCSATQQAQEAATIQKIRDAAVKACGFLPAVQTVSGVISALVSGAAPVLDVVNSGATAICNAVAPPTGTNLSVRRRASVNRAAVINGQRVDIKGKFVD